MCDSLNIPILYHPAAEMGTLAASLNLNSWIESLGGGVSGPETWGGGIGGRRGKKRGSYSLTPPE